MFSTKYTSWMAIFTYNHLICNWASGASPTLGCSIEISRDIPYFLDWNARVLLVSSELLAGVVFEGAVYSFQPLGY